MSWIYTIIKIILSKFSDMIYNSLPEDARPPKGLLNKLKNPFRNFVKNKEEEKAQTLVDRIKKDALEVIKKAKDSIVKVFKIAGPVLLEIIAVILVFVLAAFILMAIVGAFGAFQGKIVVNMDKFQELNQDEQVYMDAQNTNELRKAYYQLVSETSYYQMFNLDDMNPSTINPFLRVIQGITNHILPDELATMDEQALSAINKGIMDSQAFLGQNNILGILGFDQRYIYSDANKNALKYMKSAKVIGIEKVSGLNGDIDEINEYFRDYYNREETFMLSETLLSELNRTLFGEYRNAESIVYPEAFVKPVPFVNDFYRIQTDSESDYFGQPYVYVTQRVSTEQIENASSPYFNKPWLEGIIYTRPSKLIYDYAVVNKNTYYWSDEDNDAAKKINWGNISKYATYDEILEYADGTEDKVEKAIKLYWIVKDSNDGYDTFDETTYDHGSVNDMNPYNEHMTAGINKETYPIYFDGPYTRLTKSGNTITVDPSSKIPENGVVYLDGEGNHVNASTGVKVRHDLNLYPTRHLQLAPMYDEEGDIALNSRVLFNKTFVQKKSIKESFRHFPEYYAGFSEFVETDVNRKPPAVGLSLVVDSDDILPGAEPTSCDSTMWEEDQKKTFSQRQCSILRKYTGVNGLAWLKGKFSEMGTAISNLITGEDNEAELGVSSQAMFYILRAYEDYLIETGEYGVVWDYKYYTASEFDLALAKAQYMDVFGWKETYLDTWNDKGVYKDTLDTVKALDNARTIQTQYVPTAIISGESAATRNGNVNINNIGYGWRIKEGANLNNPSEEILERVAGESSLEYPVYSTGSMLQNLKDFIYGTIVYGPSDFRYEWENGKIKDKGEADIDAFYASLESESGKEVADEFTSEYNEKDYRNKELVWNPDADVYRPTNSYKILDVLSSSVTKYPSDGKVTYRTGPEDNLPLEVKSVRDYGLGSVLSYLEGLRVVYQAGVFMDEEYSQKGLEKAFDNLGIKGFKNYTTGYYPKDLLDKYPELLTAMRTTPMTIENLAAFAQNIVGLQYAATEEENAVSNKHQDVMDEILKRNANGLQITGLDHKKQGFEISDNSSTVGTNICINCESKCSSQPDEASKESCIQTCTAGGGYYNKDLADCNTKCRATKDIAWDNENGDSLSDEKKAELESKLQSELGSCLDKCKVDWPDRSSTCSVVDTSAVDKVYAYSPYITPDYLSRVGKKLFSWAGYESYDEVQFLDPLQYYIEWFDYFKNKDSFLDKTLAFISGSDLVSQLDSDAASLLRAAQGDPKKGFSGITNHNFGSAGKDIVGRFKDDFYNKYTSNIQPYKLISETETYRVYMIEEAVTFLGTFTYTYKDDIVNLGTGGGNTQVISLAYADRYYYMSNYIFSVPYVKYEPKQVEEYVGNWVSSKPSCPTDDPMKKAQNKYNSTKWYNPFTWFQEDVEIMDAKLACNVGVKTEPCNCKPVKDKDGKVIGQTCDTCTYYQLKYAYVASISTEATTSSAGEDAKRFDTSLEIEELLKKTDEIDPTIRDRVMIQTKVYESLDDWSWSISGNASTDFNSAVYDYEKNYASGTTFIGDNQGKHFASLSDVNKNMENRPGYKVVDEHKNLVDKTLNIPDDLNMDIDLDAGLQQPQKLLDKDLETILSVIKANDTVKTVTVPFDTVAGSVNIKTGVELTTDAKSVGVGIMAANREDYGYPIPLFRHFSGVQREILPRQKGSYFNGETLESWQTRLIITNESTNAQIKHIDNEKYLLQNYLYGYIINFETYVPFDVKSDYDLMSRGREAYHATNTSMTSNISATSSYAGDIFTFTDTPAWKETIEKFNASDGKVTQSSISQIVAGLIEVEMERAPYRTIKILNSSMKPEDSKIKMSSENQAVITEALKKSATDTGAGIDTRKVNLVLENGKNKEFTLPFFGAGAIFYDYDKLGNGTMTTDSYAVGQVCGTGQTYKECFKTVTLNITDKDDDRLTRQMSIEFVSSKFGRLLRKYGDTSKAIMAYFYGETYTEALVKKAESLGKGANWSNSDDKDLISEVLKEISSSNGVVTNSENLDVNMYSSSVIAKTLSYVQDVTSKTTLTAVAVVPANANGVDIGSKAEVGQSTYDKWASFINLYGQEYGVDAALLAAMISQESSGNSYSGICDGDGITTATMLGTRRCTKLNIGRYNGGGGIGQIHHFCDGGGQLPSRSSGKCTRTIKSNITGKTVVVNQALPSRYLHSISDLPAYEAMDDRYGNIPLAFEWAVIYISNSLKEYDGDAFKTLVAYNAGAGTVSSFITKCGEDGWYNCYANSESYGQKHNYVKAVLRYYNKNLATNDLKFSGTTSSLSSMLSTKFELKTGEIHYNRDLFSYQNSGVEFFKPSMSISRDDVKTILMNNYNFGRDVYDPYANKYDLLSLFTKREAYDMTGATGAGQSWIGFNSKITAEGQKSARTIPSEFKFAYIPPLIPMNSPTGRPVESESLTSPFGIRNLGGYEMHEGIDFGIPTGTPLYAVAPGRVATASFNDGGYGWYVKIEHVLPANTIVTATDGKQYEIVKLYTTYAHNSSLKVSVGDVISDDCSKITDGAKCINIKDPIALSGSTGRSTGPHLHFEVDMIIKDLSTGQQLPYIRANRNADPYYWLTTKWEGQ